MLSFGTLLLLISRSNDANIRHVHYSATRPNDLALGKKIHHVCETYTLTTLKSRPSPRLLPDLKTSNSSFSAGPPLSNQRVRQSSAPSSAPHLNGGRSSPSASPSSINNSPSQSLSDQAKYQLPGRRYSQRNQYLVTIFLLTV